MNRECRRAAVGVICEGKRGENEARLDQVETKLHYYITDAQNDDIALRYTLKTNHLLLACSSISRDFIAHLLQSSQDIPPKQPGSAHSTCKRQDTAPAVPKISAHRFEHRREGTGSNVKELAAGSAKLLQEAGAESSTATWSDRDIRTVQRVSIAFRSFKRLTVVVSAWGSD